MGERSELADRSVVERLGRGSLPVLAAFLSAKSLPTCHLERRALCVVGASRSYSLCAWDRGRHCPRALRGGDVDRATSTDSLGTDARLARARSDRLVRAAFGGGWSRSDGSASRLGRGATCLSEPLAIATDCILCGMPLASGGACRRSGEGEAAVVDCWGGSLRRHIRSSGDLPRTSTACAAWRQRHVRGTFVEPSAWEGLPQPAR